jgi:hypothetical protein
MEMVKIRQLRMIFVSKWDHDPNRNSELHPVYRHIPFLLHMEVRA